jgi:hypothetical protein
VCSSLRKKYQDSSQKYSMAYVTCIIEIYEKWNLSNEMTAIKNLNPQNVNVLGCQPATKYEHHKKQKSTHRNMRWSGSGGL